jgi:hypothetical protein
MVNAATLARLVGGVRFGVGVALLARPAMAGADDASSQLLVRTIGARDVVLGLGTLMAGGDERARWIRAGLTSDVADVALAAGSARALGAGGLVAVVAPLPMIAAGMAQLRAASHPSS